MTTPYRRSLLVGLCAGFFLAPWVWAGKEFPAGSDEQTVADQLLVGLKPGANIAAVIASVAPQAVASVVSKSSNTHLLKLPPGVQSTISKLLAALPEVNFVEPNRIRQINGITTPNDTYYTLQWDLPTVRALQAWSYIPNQYLTAASAGTGRLKVAVLDTGADCTHPDFKNAGGSSTDSAAGGQLLFSSSQAFVPTTIASPACSWQDDEGHGTHVVGTIAASAQNATGVVGLAYPVQVIVYKVLDSSGSGTDSTIATAIEAAADAGARVISMSLGGAGYSQSLQTAVDYAWQRNAVVVASAGNSGDSSLIYPGAANHALGVAATDSSNARAGFSTYGNWTKIAAPGVSIISTLPTYTNSFGTLNYGGLSGTSMAAPHIAAAAGLVGVAYPNVSAVAIAQLLQRSAQAGGGGWNQYTGYGILDLAAAVSNTAATASTGSLIGQVVDSSNVPVTGAVVSAGGASFTTASSGLFRLANLTPGTYTVSITASGYPAANLQAAVVSGADTAMKPRLGVTVGQFTGTVLRNGLPIAGATVAAMSGGFIQDSAISDANGTYHLYVTAGTYDLAISAVGYVNTSVTGKSVAANGATTANVSISALGNIAGMVKDSLGTPVANAQIDIASSSFSAGATTDANGQYATLGLPAGTYTVTASATGYSSTNQVVSVTANTTTPLTLVFGGSGGTAPVISAVSSSAITASGATITWTTDHAADSQVNYGTTTAYGSSSALDSTLATAHSVALSGLAASTTYHYQVLSRDSSGRLTTSGDYTFTTTSSAPPPPPPPGTSLQLHLDATEVSGTANGSVITPAVGPSGFTGTVVQNGTGSVNFAAGQSGNGVYFLNCCANSNNAYYKFTGSAVGSIFSASQGQVTFYLKSRYTWAQRQSSGGSREAFDVRDGSGAHQFYLLLQPSSGYLTLVANIWGSSAYYYVPKGTEDTLFGAGVTLKVALAWNGGTGQLYLNDGLVSTFGYTTASPNWSAASNLDIGAYEYGSYGGYYTLDDIIDEFTVSGATTAAAPVVSVTSPSSGASVSGTVTVSANATSTVGMSSVQFKLDGANLGSAVAGSGPSYSVSWNTATATNGTHTLTAVATDTGSNSTTSAGVTVTVNNAVTGPVISSVAASATASGATITWTTDKVSDSQVNYGTTASYGSASPVNSALVTSHAVTLSGLAASTTYHYQVLSQDSSGTLAASGDYTFTTSSSGSGGATLQLHLDASEVSGTANGSVVTPSVGPSGFTGTVTQNGSGSVNFAAGQSGNGVYFLNCCANYNNAYYKFTGTGVGSIFSTAQGQVTFYLKSRYTWAQRQASGSPRAAFHVRDGSGTDEMYLEVQPVGGYLGLVTKLWGTVQYYYVPKGTEDTLYGNGVTLKVTMSWNGGTGKLYLNDGLVMTFGYTPATPNWSVASNLDIGAYEYGSYGGYYSLDDIIDEFTVLPAGQ